ncbi:MAG: hypothetical protein NTV34_14220 [Proteobacteria bacterium]|nr:hypothetical protein [Pseudomonadota bacterium]
MNAKRTLRVPAAKLSFAIFVLIGLGIFIGVGHFGSNQKVARRPATKQELQSAAQIMRLPSPPHHQDRARAKLAALGKKLFFDPGFSKNGAISCASCHQPERSFTDGRPTSHGLGEGKKNTPTLINVFQGRWFFHDGRADSLAMQALGPVENSLEHGYSRKQVYERLKKNYHEDYEAMFGKFLDPLLYRDEENLKSDQNEPEIDNQKGNQKGNHKDIQQVSDQVAAYVLSTVGSTELLKKILSEAQKSRTQPIHIIQKLSAGPEIARTQNIAINNVFANFGKSIAAFEETILSGETPFDLFAERFAKTGDEAMSFVYGFGRTEFQGFQIFVGEGNCVLCHQGPYFTDMQFHNIGLPALKDEPLDLGRAQGILLAKGNDFNCLGPYLKQATPSESCGELVFAETEQSEWVGAFKTPTLRNLAFTAPYGHDGRFSALRDILQHYNTLDVKPAAGHREESLQALNLKPTEMDAVLAFLHSLGDLNRFSSGDGSSDLRDEIKP